jgi:hypothetical protein
MTVNLQFVLSPNEPRTSCAEPERCLLHVGPDDRKSLRAGRMSREKPTEGKHETSWPERLGNKSECYGINRERASLRLQGFANHVKKGSSRYTSQDRYVEYG